MTLVVIAGALVVASAWIWPGQFHGAHLLAWSMLVIAMVRRTSSAQRPLSDHPARSGEHNERR